MMFLDSYISTAKAISALLSPHAEVVIHNTTTNKIHFIANSFSKRKIGDESLLGKLVTHKEDYYPPYDKTGTKGEKIKSVSAILRDSNGDEQGMLCINFDISKFDEASRLLKNLSSIMTPHDSHPDLFKYDWREQINIELNNYLKFKNKGLKTLNKNERIEFVTIINSKKLLEAKNAINHLASLLNLTRATIYNYLRKGA